MFRTNLGVMRGLEYEHEIEYTVDGARVHTFHMGGEADFKANLVNMTKAGDVIDERGRIRLKLTAGPHVIGAAFVARSDGYQPDAPAAVHPQLDRHARHLGPSALRHLHGDRPVQRDRVRRHAEPPPDLQLPSVGSATRAAEDGCAKQIIARLARLAYRGDVTDVDLAAAVRLLRGRPRQDGHLRDAASRRPSSASWRARSSASTSSRIPRASRRRRSTASAIASSRRACRSSCGAASPTRSCSTSRRRTSCTRRRSSRSRSAACWPTRRPRR